MVSVLINHRRVVSINRINDFEKCQDFHLKSQILRPQGLILKKVKILSKSMLEQNNKGIECDDGSKKYPLIREGTLEGFVCFQYKHMVKTGTNK